MTITDNANIKPTTSTEQLIKRSRSKRKNYDHVKSLSGVSLDSSDSDCSESDMEPKIFRNAMNSSSDSNDSISSDNISTARNVGPIIVCEICQSYFMYKSWYNRHYSSVHLKSALVCKYCPKVFHRKDNLLRHT